MTPLLLLVVLGTQGGTPAFTVTELAAYRLSVPVFEQFAHASRLIVAAACDNPRLASNPLFTREISVLGDAPDMAALLEARLTSEPALADALRASHISSREYTKFAIALFAARLAHGFVKSGAMRVVPAGVATDNVAFVEAHQKEIAVVLQVMGVEEREIERSSTSSV